MRFNSFLFVVLFILTSSLMNAQSLEDYRWKNRILVLADVSIDSEALQSQLQAFTTKREALKDRDLIIFLVTEAFVYHADGKPSELNTENLRESVDIPLDFKGVLLIGKDGGVKMKEEYQVDPETVFTLIDGMPMRRTEMRKSRKS